MWLGLLDKVLLTRTVFFTGVFGSGKTLGAVALAYQLLAEYPNLRLLSNLPGVGIPFSDLDSLTDVVILLDEGRRYLDARRWKEREFNLDYLRHLNCFLLVSAAFDVDTRLRRLTVERIFHFLPFPSWSFWLYRVRFQDEPGRLAVLFSPRSYFGLYPKRFVLTRQEDAFYVLVSEFFSSLSYKEFSLDEFSQRLVSDLVEKTVSRVRSSA